jgi:cobalt-precorrin 5A hydrolase
LPSFDVAAADQGWVIDDLSRVKILNSLLLAHADVAVVDSTEKLCAYFGEVQNTRFYADFSSAAESGAEGFVFVTNRQIPEKYRSESLLVLRPKNLVLGIGCNSGTAIEEIENVVSRALERLSLSFKSVCCIATAEAKRNEAGLQEYAARYSIALSFFQADELNGTLTPSPPSTHALKAIGAIGVAEPAAVLASGNGKLLLNKIRSGNITLAIAEMG